MIQDMLEDLPAAFRPGLAGLGTMGVYLFGGWDAILKALIALVAIDFVTGVLAAYTERKLNSEVGYKGIIRKVCIFLMVAVAQIIDTSSGLGEPLLRTTVIMFFMANESLSATENMGRMRIPLPEPLKAALEKLHGRVGGALSNGMSTWRLDRDC